MEFMKNGKRIDDRLPNELRPINLMSACSNGLMGHVTLNMVEIR